MLPASAPAPEDRVGGGCRRHHVVTGTETPVAGRIRRHARARSEHLPLEALRRRRSSTSSSLLTTASPQRSQGPP
ncbi:MAG: hypothetical protein VXZ39_11580, partial [Planctomycetota bacterium]|nr:hypothetical protein [Planctomycetota bacterium]